MKRLALLALLLASSSVVAAPAPLAKPQRKADQPKKVVPEEVALPGGDLVEVRVPPPVVPAAPIPAQPPNADPPG